MFEALFELHGCGHGQHNEGRDHQHTGDPNGHGNGQSHEESKNIIYTLHLDVDDATMAHRRTAQEAKGWHPVVERKRKVSTSLKIYAIHSTSAAKGAVRVL